jgi:HK97 family phage major capsid protein
MEMTKAELMEVIKEINAGTINSLLEEFRTKHTGEPEWSKTLSASLASLGESVTRPVIESEKGILAAQYIRSVAASYCLSKGGNNTTALSYAEKVFGKESPIVKALAATSFADGGALIPPEISSDIIELLRPASVVRRMDPDSQDHGRRGLRLDRRE